MHGSRATGLLTAGLAASALAVAVYALRETPDPTLVARWWPATALATALLVSAPRRHAALAASPWSPSCFLAAGLVAGRDAVFSVGFAVANAVEAVIVLWWLTGFEVDRPELRSWTDYFRWLVAHHPGQPGPRASSPPATIGLER